MESQKIKYQEQILKDARKSLRQRESQLVFTKTKQKARKSVTFEDEYSGIILNSIGDKLDMRCLVFPGPQRQLKLPVADQKQSDISENGLP